MIRASLTLAALLFSLLLASGCSDEPGGSSETAGPTPVQLAAVQDLVAKTWVVSAAREPAVVEALLDAPGGAGWLHLFHGDLDAAEAAFRPATQDDLAAGARLGLARVHLARAAYLRQTALLHADVALEHARYRRDHSGEVRAGVYDLLASALAATQAPQEERQAFLDAAVAGLRAGRGGDLQVGKALGALATRRGEVEDPARATSPSAVPNPLGTRLRAAEQVAAGLSADLGPEQFSKPGMLDPRGSDEATGVVFTGEIWDVVPVQAAARRELAAAWILASRIGGAGALIAAAVQSAWSGPLPDLLRKAARPSSVPLPPWTALFLSATADPSDWSASWGAPDSPFGDRWADVFQPTSGDETAMATVDGLLRQGEDRRLLLLDAIIAEAPDEGAAFVRDLELARRLTDRALRTHMSKLVQAGHAAPAKRLGDRSMDPNPGAKGGAANSRETRVSYRNDRAFLVALARCLHQAGQAGAALDYLHPLAKEDARLRGAAYYLAQVDAAGSIGLAGKASQL